MIRTHNKRVQRRRTKKVWCGGSAPGKLGLTVIIDDLDRCPKKKVMEMLKATHLLLEQPKAPMVVFLAVDPQLIISAISKSLDGLSNTVSGKFTPKVH